MSTTLAPTLVLPCEDTERFIARRTAQGRSLDSPRGCTRRVGKDEDLYNAVVAAVRAGQSLEEMKASITLDEYKDWGSFGNWRELNIEGVYLRVVLQRRANCARRGPETVRREITRRCGYALGRTLETIRPSCRFDVT